jgi:hypothetical protein
LFQVISAAAAAVYRPFSLFCVLIFIIIMTFYVLYSVWDNIKGGAKNPMHVKYFKPVVINSLIVFALLGMGVFVPRFITTITFEPATDLITGYTQAALQTDTAKVEEKIIYQPQKMDDNGFYRPQLRDKIIILMKTTITQFQSYIKLGLAVMDNAFSWNAILGLGNLVKHVLMFFLGLYLVYGFFKLFLKFCFYFVDVILAMAYFAFFFPLALTLFIFQNSEAAKWVKELGKGIGANQFKAVISSIVALASAVITYLVIMVIIAKFFAGNGISANDLMNMILSGEVYEGSLSDDNLAALTLSGCILLIYLVNFLSAQIPQIKDMVLKAFNVDDKTQGVGEKFADDIMKVAGNVLSETKKVAGIIIGGGEDKKEDKKEENKEEKKEEKN